MTGILITAEALHRQLHEPGLLVLDASVELPAPRFDGDYRVDSGRQAWREAHIPGARHADLLHDLADPHAGFSFAVPDAARLGVALGRLGVGAARRIVAYDRHDGFWAARLWWTLRSLGIAAQVLDGGFRAWRRAGLPESRGDETAHSANTPISNFLQRSFWARQEDILPIIHDKAPGRLVCTLSAGLFDGSAVTRYARRGHIPGSLNRPARTLFDAHGHYLPPAALAAALGPEVLDGAGPVILYCGGGISAAAVALGLGLLGRAPAIYDGSLQEWAADPALPMATRRADS